MTTQSDMENRRTAYRQTKGLEAIRVYMGWGGKDPVECLLVDISARGAAVALSVPLLDSAESAVQVGSGVQLSFEIPGIDPLPDVRAVVRNERDNGDRREVGLEIIDWKILHDNLPPSLFSVFNRRHHYRVNVPTDPETEVAVSVPDTGRETVAVLANISGGGCMLLFPPEEAPEAGQDLEIGFRLPGTEDAIELVGTVRSASSSDATIVCGIEFSESRSSGFAAQQQRITQYVMKRQRELATLA